MKLLLPLGVLSWVCILIDDSYYLQFPSEWWNLCQLISVWCRGVSPPIILYPNTSLILQATYVWRRLDTVSECENVKAILFMHSHQQFSYVIRTVNIHWFQCYFLCWSHSLRGSLDESRGSMLAAVLFLIFSTSNASVWIHEVLSLLVFAVYGASPAKLKPSFELCADVKTLCTSIQQLGLYGCANYTNCTVTIPHECWLNVQITRQVIPKSRPFQSHMYIGMSKHHLLYLADVRRVYCTKQYNKRYIEKKLTCVMWYNLYI